MGEKWVCTVNPEHVFNSQGSGICPKCGALLTRHEEARQVRSESSPSGEEGVVQFQGEHGLGILVFDLSGSMNEKLDEENPANPTRKIDAVANAFGSTVASMLHGSAALKRPSNYFLAVIGFSDGAELLGFYDLPSMGQGDYEQTFAYWKDNIFNEFKQMGGSTNITDALKIAREIYDLALNGSLASSKYARSNPSIQNFQLGSQNVPLTDSAEVVEIPNVRVLVYSDGEHNRGAFRNAFESAALTSTVVSSSNRSVNGVMSIYFGPPSTSGAKQMESIAGYCPIHKRVGMIPIFKLEHYNHLRNLIHLTSAASGFCIECAR